VTRWTRCLLAGAIAILVPVLAGCEAGLNAPTLEYHPASFGVSTTVDGIDIDNAFVLGPALGETLPAGGQAGAFMALSTQDSGDRLLSVSAPGTASSVTLVNGPVTLTPGALVDLNGATPEIVLNGLTTPLNGGETVQLVLAFANAGAVSLSVPVEPNAYEYATFSPPVPSPSPSPSASLSAADKNKAKASATATPAVSGTASATPAPSASSTP
jgi:copper(I)-binding protein